MEHSEKRRKQAEMGGKWVKLFYFLGRFCLTPEKSETNRAEIVLFFRFSYADGTCIVPTGGIGKPTFKAMEWYVPRGTTAPCAHIAWTGQLA